MDPEGPVAQAGEARQDKTGSPVMAAVVVVRGMVGRKGSALPEKMTLGAFRSGWFTLAGLPRW